MSSARGWGRGPQKPTGREGTPQDTPPSSDYSTSPTSKDDTPSPLKGSPPPPKDTFPALKKENSLMNGDKQTTENGRPRKATGGQSEGDDEAVAGLKESVDRNKKLVDADRFAKATGEMFLKAIVKWHKRISELNEEITGLKKTVADLNKTVTELKKLIKEAKETSDATHVELVKIFGEQSEGGPTMAKLWTTWEDHKVDA